MNFTTKQKNIFDLSLAALLGVIIFCFIYSEILIPTYDDWLFTTGADPTQQYVGWMMYRSSDWSLPLGIARDYVYPFGVSVVNTDSIPLFAMAFKVISSFLPSTFQYFGFWILSCFILQGVFAYLLVKNYLQDRGLALLGAIFFILSPIMLFRLGGHFALGGHFLILASLWLLIKKHENISYWWWSLILAVSILVHPYLFLMCLAILLADILKLLFIQKTINCKKTIIFVFLEALAITILSSLVGVLTLGSSSAPGFGDFSMNLNALINPLGWSRILPDLEIIRYQGEGFNYLGGGILFLLIFSFYYFIKNKSYKKIWQKNWPILVVCILLFLLSLSNVVAYADKILFIIPLPKILSEGLFGIVRSSGRFFWPVFYLLFLWSFYFLKNIKYSLAIIVIVFALGLQIFDLSLIIQKRGLEFVNQNWENKYLQQKMPSIAAGYEHISFLPVVPNRNYMDYALYASQHGMTINNGFFARPIKNLDNGIIDEINSVKAGQIDKNTLYIFSRDHEEFIKNLDMTKHLLTQIDNTFVLSPYYQK